MKELQVKNTAYLLFVVILLTLESQSQHFQPFETGIANYPPIPYDLSNSTYRNISFGSSKATLAANGSFVFSILSFNYFMREAFCLKPVKNLISNIMVISCSPNVYILSYMFFDKGPNIFVYHTERLYTAGKNSTDIVDITKWMGSVKFPLKSLVKSSLKQYQIRVVNFITGVSLFQNKANLTLSVSNSFGKVKLDPFYYNITIDNETKIWAPVGINISTSPSVEKVSFYSLIVIKEMISMSMNFETISFEGQSGIQRLGYFAGINEMSFYLSDQTKSGYQSVSFNVTYNYKIPYLNTTNITQIFAPQKLFIFTKGSNLNIKLTKLTQIFYRRCSNASLNHFYPNDIPKEGKYYKISPAFNTGLVWQVTSQGKIKLAKWSNTLSQKFYFLYKGAATNDVIIMNAELKKSVRCQLPKTNDTLQLGAINESDVKGVWIFRYLKSNNMQITYFDSRSNLYRIGLLKSTAQQGQPLIQATPGSILGSTQQFIITEVNMSDEVVGVNKTVSYEGVLNTTIYNITYFNSFFDIWTSMNAASTSPYSYYSIEQEKCYDKALLDSQLANTTLNNFRQSTIPSVLPYFMDVNKTLSQTTISRNANTSSINTSTIEFAQGYMYGVCVNRITLNNFFNQVNQGWTGFVVDNFDALFVGSNTSSFVVNDSGNDAQNKTEEKLLIVMPYGCVKMKIHDLSLMQYECQVCKENYILYQFINLAQNSSSSVPVFNPKKCICEMGYFMNQTGQCILCSFHQTNCKPQITVQASLSLSNQFSTKFSLTDSRTLLITVQIINDRYSYSYMNSVEKVYGYIVMYVNGKGYALENENVKKCTNNSRELSNASLCIDIRLDNVRKASQYMVSVGTNISSSDNLVDSYLLINETQSTSDLYSQQASQTFQTVGSNDTTGNQSTQQTSQSLSKIYFSKIQTYEVVVSEPFTAQKVVDNIEPIVSTLNSSSSVFMLAAPFLMDKINIFSLLQTNSLLYMISFLKFSSQDGEQSEVQSVAKKLFIFRPQPLFNPFSLKSQQAIPSNESPYIQVPRYTTLFQNGFIYNLSSSSTLRYPQILYREAISSLSQEKGSQNYLTLTLNALLNMGMQILLMEMFIFGVIFCCSTITEKNSSIEGDEGKQEMIKKKVEYEITRHKFVNLLKQAVDKTWEYKQIPTQKQRYEVMIQKRIQWESIPQLKQCQKITILEDPTKQQVDTSQHQNRQSTNESQLPIQSEQDEDQPTLKQNILFIVTGIKQKRYIFYSSFVMIQLISQTYLLYFELVKPLDPTSSDAALNVLNYLDMIFGLVMMFLVLVFPVFLINYEPLHLLKIVAIISKFGGYKFSGQKATSLRANNDNQSESLQKKFIQNSYGYGQIYFHFCIIYYEIILIPFSIAMGPTIFYQTLPIVCYQIFKLVWMFKRLKILDKLKILTLLFLFALSGTWDYIDNDYIKTNIIANAIIWSIYIVLFIEFTKLFKFLIVFLMKSLRLKKSEDKQSSQKGQSKNSKNLIKYKSSQTNEVSIVAIQEEPNFNFPKEISDLHEFDSEKHMIEKKKQKIETLKRKQFMLNEISKVRQNLRENLELMRNRRKNVGQKTSQLKEN